MNKIIEIKGINFEIKDLSGISKYATNEYIGRYFGTDLCLQYLGKDNKGKPYIVCECQVCGRLREVVAYNLGRRGLKKCECNRKTGSNEKRLEIYSEYLGQNIYELQIENIRRQGNNFYFKGICKHGNKVEVNCKSFLKNKKYKCDCEKLRKLDNRNEEMIIDENKRGIERLKGIEGKIIDNKKILSIEYNMIDLSKRLNYQRVYGLVECVYCGRKYRVPIYSYYRLWRDPNIILESPLRVCICQKSEYMNPKYINQKFGHLIVKNIRYDEKQRVVLWECECDCKNKTKVVKVASLIEKGSISSCGCQRRNSIQERSPYVKEEYIGKIYGQVNNEGGLKVVDIDRDSKEMGIIWDCECLFCHKIVKLPAGQVAKGNLQSCGCHHTANTTYYDDKKYIGQKFNGIEVIDIVGNSGKGYIWKCKCPYCDKEFNYLASKIVHNRKLSCGCKDLSYYEYKIDEYLKTNNIEYRREVIFDDLKGEKGRPYRYDFGIYKNGKLLALIEYDGEQHYNVDAQVKVKTKEEAKRVFEITQRRDRAKDEYAKRKGIVLKRFRKENGLQEIFDYIDNLVKD